MRKSGIFLVILLIICGLGAVYVHAQVVSSQEDVEYHVKVAYGEAARTEGLTVTEQTQFGWTGRVFWNMVCQLGEEPAAEAENVFLSYAEQEFFQGESLTELSLSSAYWSCIGSDLTFEGMHFGGLEKALQEVADGTLPGQSSIRVVPGSDYCDYYPWDVQIQLGTVYYNSFDAALWETSGNEEESIFEKLQEKFQIPVPDSCRIGVAVVKDENGTIIDLELYDYEECVYTIASSGTDSCYFAINSTYRDMDLTQIPIGYGIYEMKPADSDGNNQNLAAAVDGIRCVYAFETDENIEVLDLWRSSDGKNLEMLSLEKGVEYVSVIDMETWQLKQKLEIGEGDYYMQREDALMLFFSEDEMLLAAKQKDGDYEKVSFPVQLGSLELPHLAKGESTWKVFSNILLYSKGSMAWDGTRLAVVSDYVDWNYGEEYYSMWGSSDFCVCIFESSGLSCLATYECSLNTLGYTDPVQSMPSSQYVTLQEENGLSAQFN